MREAPDAGETENSGIFRADHGIASGRVDRTRIEPAQIRVAGEMLPLRAGDIAFIPAGPEYPHQIINTSGAPLKYLSISTRDVPEIVEYPDSEKYLAMTSAGGRHFSALQRAANSLDYWDGEP